MNNPTQVSQQLKDYVKAHTLASPVEISEHTMLFKEGIFDSMAFILLLDFIEESFNIKPSDSELIEKNFESIGAITSFVINKKNAGVSGRGST
ncbi:MAG TPA: acyl carrier protein [Bacteroidales bacterium]|nr:acyl carrier protein [Bacteroidales bacterium]